MPNNTRDGRAVCPFFETSQKNYIRCECVIGGDARLMHVFDNSAIAAEYVLEFCCTYEYTSCPYAHMLINAYDEISKR